MTTTPIRSREDIRELLRASVEQGGLLLDESHLGPEFFDADGGLAREVAQKFTIFRARLAVVVADPTAHGAAFAELVREHRTHAVVRFFGSHQLARQWLSHLPGKK